MSAERNEILRSLYFTATGKTPYGGPRPTPDEQNEATRMYLEMDQQVQEHALKAKDQEDQVRLEEEKLQIRKAELVLEAVKIAGDNGHDIGPMLEAVAGNLLGDGALRQLTQKEE